MKTITKIYTIAGIVLFSSVSGWAQTTTPSAPGVGHGEWREKWKHMTPEQKETFLQNHPKIAAWIKEHQQELEADASAGNSSTGSPLTGSPSGSPSTGSPSTGSPSPGSPSTGSTASGATTSGGVTPSTSTTSTSTGTGAGKWAQMTPVQKEAFLQNHPAIAQQFSQNHPEAAQRLAATKEAGAGIADPGHPRVNEVNGRETNQQNRIAQGASSGKLTPQEQAQLQKSGNRIQKQEGNDLAKHDGHLTAGEKARLNHEENRRSRQIYKDKHDS